MTLKIQIYNPSPYPRGGHVSTPWEPVRRRLDVPPEELVLRDEKGRVLPSQVDRIDPEDPSRDALVFHLTESLPPGEEGYSRPSGFVTVGRGATAAPDESGPRLETLKAAEREYAVGLYNSRLALWLNLLPQPGAGADIRGANWYAGSATSVQLDGKEVLDALGGLGWLDHDPEKRCMQVDRLRLSTDPRGSDSAREVSLFDRPYRLVSASGGPARAVVTVASEPIPVFLPGGAAGGWRAAECQLYRVVSLHRDADFVTEELFLRESAAGGGAAPEAPGLHFAAGYFAYLAMGLDPHLYRRDDTTWFAVGLTWAPYTGYGFAADVPLDSLRHPSPGFPDPDKALHTYSWQLRPARAVRCLHLFMGLKPERSEFRHDLGFIQIVTTLEQMAGQNFEHRTGHAWYEHIYRPLVARI